MSYRTCTQCNAKLKAYFLKDGRCNACMNPHLLAEARVLLVPEYRPDIIHTVPFSELAMHMRIAGRHISYAYIEGRIATVCVDGHSDHYTGLSSELLPFELRGKGESHE